MIRKCHFQFIPNPTTKSPLLKNKLNLLDIFKKQNMHNSLTATIFPLIMLSPCLGSCGFK